MISQSMESVSSSSILMMKGQGGRNVHRCGGILQVEEVHSWFPIFVVATGVQASRSLKCIVSGSIYRVKESLNRHPSEEAVTGLGLFKQFQ